MMERTGGQRFKKNGNSTRRKQEGMEKNSRRSKVYQKLSRVRVKVKMN